MANLSKDYKSWIVELKQRIRQSQIKAAVKVNTELLRLYWELGRDIVTRQMESTWGSGFFEQLSRDLRGEFPDMQGFSARNLDYMKRFYSFYTQDNLTLQQLGAKLDTVNLQQLVANLQMPENKQDVILQQVVEEFDNHPIFRIPWGHHVQIFTKCKTLKEALFYVQKTIENGWSRAMLNKSYKLRVISYYE